MNNLIKSNKTKIYIRKDQTEEKPLTAEVTLLQNEL